MGGVIGLVAVILVYIYLLFTHFLPNCPGCQSYRGVDAFVFNIRHLSFEEVLIFIGLAVAFFVAGSVAGLLYDKIKNHKKLEAIN